MKLKEKKERACFNMFKRLSKQKEMKTFQKTSFEYVSASVCIYLSTLFNRSLLVITPSDS